MGMLRQLVVVGLCKHSRFKREPGRFDNLFGFAQELQSTRIWFELEYNLQLHGQTLSIGVSFQHFAAFNKC